MFRNYHISETPNLFVSLADPSAATLVHNFRNNIRAVINDDPPTSVTEAVVACNTRYDEFTPLVSVMHRLSDSYGINTFLETYRTLPREILTPDNAYILLLDFIQHFV